MSALLASSPTRAIAGLLLATLVAFAARYLKTLSTSGAMASVLVATASTAAGWSWGFILIVFFLASTSLSRLGATPKRAATGDVVEKRGPRDALQVLANGGPFAAAAISSLIWPSHLWQVLGAGAIAASSADTWSTEIGTLSRRSPRSITSWTRVPPGTSGGITWLGLIGSLGGASVIALVTFLSGWSSRSLCAAIVGGVAGSLVDSLLGATVQLRRWCPKCGRGTEREIHSCGTATEITGGAHWLDNDAVNVISSIAGAMAGAACLL